MKNIDINKESLLYNGTEYIVGNHIRANANSEYEGLYGVINEIRDGENKETENNTPDIYCCFEEPVIPWEIEKIEEQFSDAYGEKKHISDIPLDCVIMAPDMIVPVNNHTLRTTKKIYALCIDWAACGGEGIDFEIFDNYDDAKEAMRNGLTEEIKNGCIARWQGKGNLVVDWNYNDFYEAYLDGYYTDNHYSIFIQERRLKGKYDAMTTKLQEKLQALCIALAEAEAEIPRETCSDSNWEDLFEECANLRQAFENIGTEDGIVPEFDERRLEGDI